MEPLDVALPEMARVLAPGGALVTLTHLWAIERRMTIWRWIDSAGLLLAGCGFEERTHREAHYRSGQALMLRARIPLERNPMAP